MDSDVVAGGRFVAATNGLVEDDEVNWRIGFGNTDVRLAHDGRLYRVGVQRLPNTPRADGGGTVAVVTAHLPRWTHVALRVSDIDVSIAFYTEHTPLQLLQKTSDGKGYGAWLGHPDNPDSPFILVLAQFFPEHDPYIDSPASTLGPFAHLGIELASREDVDAAAATAEAQGLLHLAPIQLPAPVGYVCMVHDPDGNTIEFSFDQGVFEFAHGHMSPDT